VKLNAQDTPAQSAYGFIIMSSSGFELNRSSRGQHYLKKVQSLWSDAGAKQEASVKPLTQEQKLRAMLGYQELAGGQRNPVFWREGR
jgi:hypothetical protein